MMTRKQKNRLAYVMNTFQQVIAVFENNGFVLHTNEKLSRAQYGRGEHLDLEFCCCLTSLIQDIQTTVTFTYDSILHPRTGTTEVMPIGIRLSIHMEANGATLEFETLSQKTWTIHAEDPPNQSNPLTLAFHTFRDLIRAEQRPVKNRKFLNRLDEYLRAASR